MAAARYVLVIGKREHTQMKTIFSDIIDALAAAAFVAGVICIAIALNP
jgi:hypothetical protein